MVVAQPILSPFWCYDVVVRLESAYHISQMPRVIATMNTFANSFAIGNTPTKEFHFPRRFGKTLTCIAYALQLCAVSRDTHVLMVTTGVRAARAMRKKLDDLQWPDVTSRIRVRAATEDVTPLNYAEYVIVDECAFVDEWPSIRLKNFRAVGLTTPLLLAT